MLTSFRLEQDRPRSQGNKAIQATPWLLPRAPPGAGSAKLGVTTAGQARVEPAAERRRALTRHRDDGRPRPERRPAADPDPHDDANLCPAERAVVQAQAPEAAQADRDADRRLARGQEEAAAKDEVAVGGPPAGVALAAGDRPVGRGGERSRDHDPAVRPREAVARR